MKVVFKDEDEKKILIRAIKGVCCPEYLGLDKQDCSKVMCLECWEKALENAPYSVDNFKPMTQADRIRSMTDEELAEFLLSDYYYIDCVVCREPKDKNGDCVGECENELLRWLKSEVGCE